MNIFLPQGTPPETIELARRHVENAGFSVNWIGETADPKQQSPQIHSEPGQADEAATVFDMLSALIGAPSAPLFEPPPGVGAQRCEFGWELVELDDDGSVLPGTESDDSYASEAEAHAAAWQSVAQSHGLEFVDDDNEIALRPRFEALNPTHGFDSYREAWEQMAPLYGVEVDGPNYDTRGVPDGYRVDMTRGGRWFWATSRAKREGFVSEDEAKASAWQHSQQTPPRLDAPFVTVTLTRRQLDIIEYLLERGGHDLRGFLASVDPKKEGYTQDEADHLDWIGDSFADRALVSFLNRAHKAVNVSPMALACRRLVLAYAVADEDNGGGASIAWADIDDAHSAAVEGLGRDVCAQIDGMAKAVNKH